MLRSISMLKQPGASMRTFSTSLRSSDIARVTLVGRLGASPIVQKDKQGRDILIYSVATSDRAPPSTDGSRPEPTTTWHRVLSYQQGGKEYLSTLPAGTLVHIEADFKKRTVKTEAGEYNDQTLMLLNRLDVLSKPKSAEGSSSAEASA
ncbi:hypothetical protein P389DRAFT_210351 [Cystobasidium minutum MCA 4210]|uniref:uncharacterized protein n=1 Tax=Cystobasidium minutum MCA 4210 TaxID=1397322 RepID=UPI0034CF8174|eukprot:jgi/Rhomi1/210351/estExt_Genemark1.C_3_t30110